MAPKYGYWELRGLGQPIKLLLAYAGVEYEDKVYELDWDAWVAEKYSLGLVFPNLPYYIDEEKGVRLTHMVAIMRHIAREHDLIVNPGGPANTGDGEEAATRQDMAEQQVQDFRKLVIQLCYTEWVDEEKKRAFFEDKLPQNMKEFSAFLGENNWMAGKKLTYVDFLCYEFFDWALYLDPTCMDLYNNLREYMKRFEGLPQIMSYMKSDSFMSWPLFYKTAYFGFKEEDKKLRFPDA
jgi:glutathione S-transferase